MGAKIESPTEISLSDLPASPTLSKTQPVVFSWASSRGGIATRRSLHHVGHDHLLATSMEHCCAKSGTDQTPSFYNS